MIGILKDMTKSYVIVCFKDTFAVDVIAVHLVQDIGFAKEGNVIDDSRGRYTYLP